MDKHLSQHINERLEGFLEERIPELIDFIEFLKQNNKAYIEKSIKTRKMVCFPEAGP